MRRIIHDQPAIIVRIDMTAERNGHCALSPIAGTPVAGTSVADGVMSRRNRRIDHYEAPFAGTPLSAAILVA